MNLVQWTAIREYVQAEVQLALVTNGVGDTTPRRIESLQAQVSRMETAVRESLLERG